MSELRSDGLIRLMARSGRRLSWLVPTWAVACGALASGALTPTLSTGIRLLLVLLLVDAGWGTLWNALSTTDWSTPLRRWRNWHLGEKWPSPPYTQPDSPASLAVQWLGQLYSWSDAVLAPVAGRAVGAAVVGLVLSLALSAALGSGAVLLTIASLALMQMALLADRGRGQAGSAWDGALRLGLPWLIGHLALAPITPASLALAVAFSLAVAGIGHADQPRGLALWVTGQLAAAALLLLLQLALAVPFAVLTLIPQILLFRAAEKPRDWIYQAWSWMAAGMLLAAWVLPA